MREEMEKYQVWLYLFSILVGMGIGWISPDTTGAWEAVLWPVLGLLLYTTFTQVPMVHLGPAFRDRRFLIALFAGNFILIPILVALLLFLIPGEASAIRLGVLLVLLVPCTDWFISFTHLGRGDGARAIAAAPLLLVAQLVLLPIYLWLFMDDLAVNLTVGSHLLPAFLGLIVAPLVLAWLTEKLTEKRRSTQRLVQRLGWLPIPLLAVVVFLIAGSQVSLVITQGSLLYSVLGIFVLYLVAAALIGKGLSRLFKLECAVGRALTFSFGTRNSFVMLPLALSLPDAWSMAVVVVVFQSLVELFGMIAYLRWVPGYLIKEGG